MAQSSPGSPGLLSAGVSHAGERDEDRSFARDLNLDQIVAAIAGDREEAAEDERHCRPDRPSGRQRPR